MFEKLAVAIEKYLAREISLADLRKADDELAADILLAKPAERDQAAFDLEGKLFGGLVLLDNGDLEIDEFDTDLREHLREARASLAA
jgi:hypothetical protein